MDALICIAETYFGTYSKTGSLATDEASHFITEDTTMTQPKAFNQVIGNVAAIERIKSAITENNGLGGCVFFLQGETGNGKSMLADMIADLAGGDADSYMVEWIGTVGQCDWDNPFRIITLDEYNAENVGNVHADVNPVALPEDRKSVV